MFLGRALSKINAAIWCGRRDFAPKGGATADVADVLGISEHIARQHYAKWSAARQERISTIMRAVHDGALTAAQTPQGREGKPAVIQ